MHTWTGPSYFYDMNLETPYRQMRYLICMHAYIHAYHKYMHTYMDRTTHTNKHMHTYIHGQDPAIYEHLLRRKSGNTAQADALLDMYARIHTYIHTYKTHTCIHTNTYMHTMHT